MLSSSIVVLGKKMILSSLGNRETIAALFYQAVTTCDVP